MSSTFYKERLISLKKKNPTFDHCKDYELFTLLCIKYFFYTDDVPFDQDFVIDMLTDGANDGGIDAIFNDPTSENNDIIVVQSKYYQNTNLKSDQVIGELYKINETLKDLGKNKTEGYNEKLVTAYRNATSQTLDGYEIKIVFFTSYQPNGKREENKLAKNVQSYFKNYAFEMNYHNDIQSQIEMIENGKICVDNDKLLIDSKDNYLEYEDSVIVNISARSLQELFQRRRNSLLGLNLRYYIRKKDVDEGIDSTIRKTPEDFWYKNNGILIICDDYKIDGKVLKLSNFSIVNGGQTTSRIGKIDFDKDFYLQCKVVKSKGENQNDRDKFALSIAESTNSQKPIKKADLKANTPEQLRLRENLNKKGVYYITKKGDKTPKQYSLPYQSTTLETIGKIGLAAVLQMPGSARSNSARMYNDENYYLIFGDKAKVGVYADLLRIQYYYDQFTKTQIKDKGYDEITVLPMIKNGRTFQLACITFLCKINSGVFTYDTIKTLFNNTDALKPVLREMGDMDQIIKTKYDDEQQMFYDLFSIIGQDVLGYCYDSALYKASEEQVALAPSNYLKNDTNYYRDVIKRVWARYNQDKTLKTIIQKINTKI